MAASRWASRPMRTSPSGRGCSGSSGTSCRRRAKRGRVASRSSREELMRTALVLAGALIAIGWGIAHVVPTRRVIAGFGPISLDNRRILTMEWIAEGLSLAFVGALALLVELAGAGSAVVVLRACAAMLLAMAALTAATGARTE